MSTKTLTSLPRKNCPENRGQIITKEWYLEAMTKKVDSTHWVEAGQDVKRFLKAHEIETLKLWSREFFLDRLSKMASYLK